MSADRRRGGAVDQAGEHLSAGGRLVAGDGRTLPLRGVGLRAQARGGLARVLLEQRFVNSYPEALRVSYQVPLPADGAVAGCAFRVGDRRVVGEVDRLEAARERFEGALLEGRTAAVLGQTRANLFNHGAVMTEREALIESATTAWRPAGTDAVRPHPAWADLDAAGRLQAYEAARLLRRLEAALDADGLSTTSRGVLERISGTRRSR